MEATVNKAFAMDVMKILGITQNDPAFLDYLDRAARLFELDADTHVVAAQILADIGFHAE